MGVLVITLFMPSSSRAQGSSEVRSYLVSVSRLYESLEYERALEQIASARRLARGMEEDVLLALYEGIILSDMGRWGEATVAFKSALFLRPEAQLPVKVAPKVEKHFESARKQVEKELGPAALAERKKQSEEKARQETQSRVTQPPETTPREPTVSARSDLRSRALIPAIAGGVLLVAGGVSYGLARNEQSKFDNNDPSLATRADVRASISRGKTYQTLGFGLLGAGVVGLGVATGLFVLGAPQESVALGLSTDGTSAFVYGRWP